MKVTSSLDSQGTLDLLIHDFVDQDGLGIVYKDGDHWVLAISLLREKILVQPGEIIVAEFQAREQGGRIRWYRKNEKTMS